MVLDLLLKTPDFESQFRKDSTLLRIDNRPLKELGSYKIKRYDEPITDIDLTTFVHYNPSLLQKIITLLNRVKNVFIFIRLSCGKQKGFISPWIIDSRGGCSVDFSAFSSWLAFLKTKIPSSTYEIVKSNLSLPLTLKNLIDTENILSSFSDIVWYKKDIEKGYKIIDDIKYDFLTIAKSENPVIEFVYTYKQQICSVDLGLVDKDYTLASKQNPMYSYYTQNWYKIMKLYRWKIEDKYRPKYFKIMSSISNLIAVKYQIDLYEKTKDYNFPFNHRLLQIIQNNTKELDYSGSFTSISDKIYQDINKTLEKYIEYFRTKVKPYLYTEFFIQYTRGLQAKIPLTKSKLKERQELSCPFFSVDIDEYEKIVKLSIRTGINLKKLLDCLKTVSKKEKIKISILLQNLGNNSLKIIPKSSRLEIIDEKLKKIIETGTRDDLLRFQRYILIN